MAVDAAFAGLLVSIFLRTMRVQTKPHAELRGMFESAKKLILKDRMKAKKALTAEYKRLEQEDIEAELDQLEHEERARILEEEREAARARELKESIKSLESAKLRQQELASTFDKAITEANSSFEELEALSTTVAQLEQITQSGVGRRPAIAGHARTGALVAAFWCSGRPLSKRLGLRVVPGGRKSIKPLSAIYSSPERNEQ